MKCILQGTSCIQREASVPVGADTDPIGISPRSLAP